MDDIIAEAGGASAPSESVEEMEKRHKSELRELEYTVRTMLKGAKKSQRAELEAKAIQMEYDLKAKHREEEDTLEELIEKLGGLETVFSGSKSSGAAEAAAAEAAAAKAKEECEAAARRAKAQKKKDKAKTKEAEREAKKEEIANSAGPSLRQVELDAINGALLQERLAVKEVISDGNCLYRAFSEQLKLTGGAAPALGFAELRVAAADYMTAHPDDFAPFVGMDSDSAEFREYVANVSRSTGEVEWGGQLEIRALCGAIRRCALVYDANAPVLTMGEEYAGTGPPLRLSFHRHYFSLGEHYNSVAPLDTET